MQRPLRLRYPLRTNFCRHLQSAGTRPCLDSGGKNHFTDVEIPAAVRPNVMRSEEVSFRAGIVAATPPFQQLAFAVEDTQPAADRVGRRRLHAGIQSGSPAHLGYIELVVGADVDVARAQNTRPFADVLSLGD